MVPRIRESLALVLIALLPLHALLVTVFTKVLIGPGHSPLAFLVVWKEGVLALLLVLAFIELWPRIRSSSDADSPWTLDSLDWCILLGLFLSVVVSYVIGAESSSFINVITGHLSQTDKRFLVGFKYDFLPLVVFVVLRRLEWSDRWLRRAICSLLIVGTLVTVYGLFTVNKPMMFFTSLGYSDQTSLYFSTGPLAAFQQVEDSLVRRAQSTFSGPNQFGLWLLLPLATAIYWFAVLFVRRHDMSKIVRSSLLLALSIVTVLIGCGMFASLSRTSWIAGLAMILLSFILLIVWAFRMHLHRTLAVSALIVLVLAILGGGYAAMQSTSSILVRIQSGAGHIEKPLLALKTMKAHPLGLGLGTAGPASNAFSDTCVFLPLGADFSWAKSQKNLCVFLGGVRKLPAGKVCECPLLTENWYLQFGVEMGWLGLVFSVVLAILILLPIVRLPLANPRCAVLLGFFGISVAGLFLHSFEDSAVAYTIWLLLATALPLRLRRSIEG